MGLKGDWKHLLIKLWPGCWIQQPPPNEPYTRIIIDGQILMYRLVTGAMTGIDIRKRLENQFKHMWTSELKSIVVLFDDVEFVPINKQRVWLERKKAADKNNPFPPSDWDQIQIGDGPLPDMTRFMATRPLIVRLIAYITVCLQNLDIAVIQNKDSSRRLTMEIDGARILEIINDQPHYVSRHMEIDYRKRVVTTTSSRDERPGCSNLVDISESHHQIGEADLKIVYYVRKYANERVLVRCCDSDLLPILLLHVYRWIDPVSDTVNRMVHLDASTHDWYTYPNGPEERNGETTKKKTAPPHRNLLDVLSLWRTILGHFHTHYPTVRHPIETVVVLMLLGGNDYLESIPYVGCGTIWDAFDGGGHALFDWTENTLRVHDTDVDIKTGDGPRSVVIAEHKLYQWIVFLLYTAIIKKTDYCTTTNHSTKKYNFQKFGLHAQPVPEFACRYIERTSGSIDVSLFRQLTALDITMIEVRCEADAINQKRAKNRIKKNGTADGGHQLFIPADSALRRMIRNIAWCIDYLLNLPVSDRHFGDPIAMDESSGRSIWGWQLGVVENEKTKQKEYNQIIFAPCIHQFTAAESSNTL